MKKNRPYVTKWAPANILDTRRTEAWLEKMAAQGLVYQRQSNWNWVLGWFFCTIPHLFFARFQREAPKFSRRYRLVPAPKSERPSPEQLELYAQSGWQYVDFIDLFFASFLLFCSDDPRAVEPYTDPDSFRLAYRFPVRGLVVVILLLAGFNVLYRALGVGIPRIEGPFTPTLPALLSAWGLAASRALTLLVALAVLVNFFLDLRAAELIRSQVRQCQTTRPTLPEKLFPAQKCLTLAAAVLFLINLILSAVLIVLTAVQAPRTDVPLAELETDFDLLLLSEMEGDGSWVPARDWSLASADVEVRYNVADISTRPAQEIETLYFIEQDGSGSSGASSMDLYYCSTDGPQSAQTLLALLAQAQQNPEDSLTSELPEDLPFQTETVPGAEEFLVRRQGKDWEVLAQAEGRVLLLQYSGALDLTDWYEEIVAMLTPRAAGEAPSIEHPVREEIPLSEFDPDFPLFSLETMEGDGSWTPSEDIQLPISGQIIRQNYVTVVWAPDRSAPLQYSVDQTGTGTSGNSQLNMTYYFSENAQAAQRQLESLLADHSEWIQADRYDSDSFQEVEVPGAEEFLVHTVGVDPEDDVEPYWVVLARKGDRTLELEYRGYLDLTDWYDEIAAMLTPEE